IAFFIRCRQSLAGRLDDFASITRTRTRRNKNEQVNAWQGAVAGLPAVAARLRDVQVLNRPALEVIAGHDGPHTLFYLDPPYLHETRTAREVYGPHEMSERDHAELLDLLCRVKGKVILSGYANRLYDTALSSWNRHEREIANHAAGGQTKRRM